MPRCKCMKLPVSGVSMLSSMYFGSTAPSGISLSARSSEGRATTTIGAGNGGRVRKSEGGGGGGSDERGAERVLNTVHGVMYPRVSFYLRTASHNTGP